MQSMQRHFGKFMKRSADDSHVAILLKDFDEADKLLGRIIDSTSAWRDAWSSLLTHQSRMLSEFEGLYAPIIGSSESDSKAAPTPELTLARTNKLREEYEDLQKELLQELAAVDERMIQPAMQAREYFIPVKKTIKKRDDRKLDYERYQGRVDSYNKKTKRSERDNAALSKGETDLAKATEDYHAADEHLRQNLPPLITAAFSMLPRLLATQIEIQNSMLAHYYTAIFNYSEQEKFPSPPLPMEQIVLEWEQDLSPIQQEIESFGCLANGKTVRQGAHGSDEHRNGSVSSPPSSSGGFGTRRRCSGNIQPIQSATSPGRKIAPPSPAYDTKPKISSLASSSPSPNLAVPNAHISRQASASSLNESYVSANEYPRRPSTGLSPASSRPDYFSRTPSSGGGTAVSPGYSVLAAAVGKKAPPPPPKPRAVSNTAVFVTALYDFGGQSAGDLAFQEGDRIRVVKKTESTDDWWEGELRGVKGSFPANYVE